jgi:AraC-like DNA-binding protein
VYGRVELKPGQIMQYAMGSDHYQRSSGEISWGAMSLSPEDFTAAARAVAGCDIHAPASDRVIRPPGELMARLLRLHEAAARLAVTAPEIVAQPEVARAIEQTLLSVMVNCLVEGLAAARDWGGRPRGHVMRRFEQLLEANPDETFYLPEICAAIGVPTRTLRQHCIEHLGMSPHAYLWLRRMNLARRSLARADPKAATVAAIANNHGFAELGRFAVTYQKLFGETPSETLQPPPRPSGTWLRLTRDNSCRFCIVTPRPDP